MTLDYATRMNEEFAEGVRMMDRLNSFDLAPVLTPKPLAIATLAQSANNLNFATPSDGRAHMHTTCHNTHTQGLRGISFLFASGDSGVGSAFGACTTFTPQVRE